MKENQKLSLSLILFLIIFTSIFSETGNFKNSSVQTDPRKDAVWMAGFWNNGHSSMNPLIGPINDFSGVFFMYLPLFDTNSQVYTDYLNPSNLIPLLGLNVAWNPDGSQLTINLRPQAKWSDGSSVSSADVVFSLQAYTGLNSSAYGGKGIFKDLLFNQINNIIATSPTQVVISLNSNYYYSEAVYENLLIGGSPIVPLKVFQGKNDSYTNNWFFDSILTQNKIVDGPYQPYNSTSDGNIAYIIRDESWWMAGIVDNNNFITWRIPEPKYIVSYIVPNTFDQNTAFPNGDIDLFGSYVPNVGTLISQNSILHTWFEGTSGSQYYPLTSAMNEIVFNYDYYPLDQTWFHKALASAINYKNISDTVVSGYIEQATPTWLDDNQPAMKSYYNVTLASKWALNPSYSKSLSYMQQGAYQKNGAWYTLDATPFLGKKYAFSGQTIVSTPGENTVSTLGDMDPNHLGINLLIGGENQNWFIPCVDGWTDHMSELNIITQNWKSFLNITIKYSSQDYSTFVNNRGIVQPDGTINRNYFMYYSSLGNRLDTSPLNFFQYFAGTTDPAYNVTNWVNNDFLSNLTALSKAYSLASQKLYVNNLQDLLGQYMPSIPVAVNCYWYLYSSKYWQGWPNGNNEVNGYYTAFNQYASISDYVPVTTHWTSDHFGHDLLIINNLKQVQSTIPIISTTPSINLPKNNDLLLNLVIGFVIVLLLLSFGFIFIRKIKPKNTKQKVQPLRGFPDYETFQKGEKLGAYSYKDYGLILKLNAPDYETAKMIQKKGFSNYDDYLHAEALGASNTKELLYIQKYKAKNLETAKKIEQGGFLDQEMYEKGIKFGASTKSELDLVEKYSANSLDQAKKIEQGGFPSSEAYFKASSEGFSDYKSYNIKEERKNKLLKIMEVSTKITKDDLMKYLGIDDQVAFLDWLVNLPKGSPLFLEENTIIFQKREMSQMSLNENIDQLLRSFDKTGKDKIIK